MLGGWTPLTEHFFDELFQLITCLGVFLHTMSNTESTHPKFDSFGVDHSDAVGQLCNCDPAEIPTDGLQRIQDTLQNESTQLSVVSDTMFMG